MALVYGIGEGMGVGSSQAYAMDLAPDDRRGAFLGVWSLLQNAGSIIAPFSIGLMADALGFGPTLTIVAALLVISALLTWMFGIESHPRHARSAARAVTGAPSS